MYLRLVRLPFLAIIFIAISFGLLRCQAGERFDKVAQECSEDKAKGIDFNYSVFGVSYSKSSFSCKLVVVWVGWLADQWWYVLFLSI